MSSEVEDYQIENFKYFIYGFEVIIFRLKNKYCNYIYIRLRLKQQTQKNQLELMYSFL